MKSIPIVLIISTLIVCHGHLEELGNLLTQEIAKKPAVQAASKLTGNTIASALNALSTIPLVLSRAFGSAEIFFPTLISNQNNVDLTEKVLADYRAGSSNEDAHLHIIELIPKYGRTVEEHFLVTPDGYNLTMHRIPSNGSVVFLMHGLLGSSDDFVISGPEKAFAYLLSDAGYDVWMGNARGNKHSRRHLEMKPSDPKFWDFSWHEIGILDLPTMIDYALIISEKNKLKYVGHSQGTTSFFVMASEMPEYNNKISIMIALSPVAFMSNVRSPIVRMLAAGGPILHQLSQSLGLYEFFPDNVMMRSLRQLMCGFGTLAEILCSNAMFLFTGFGFEQMDVKNLPVLLGHSPSGASMKQLMHYGQEVVSGNFKQFDYDVQENLRVYESEKPPKYDLSRVTAPVSLFYSDEDWLAHPADVDRLYNALSNCIDVHKVPHKQFNHIDFLFGKDCKSLVFDRVYNLLRVYEDRDVI